MTTMSSQRPSRAHLALWASLCFLIAGLALAQRNDVEVCRDDLDIVFVIDGSWSVGETLFEKEKHFLATTLKNLGDTVVKKTRVGVIQFGTKPHSEFSLHSFSTAMDIDQRLQSVPLRGGGRYLGRAISFALTEYLPPPSGRTTVLVVLLTGNSQDNIHPILQSILQSTLHLVVVGVKNAPIPSLNMDLFDKRFFASDFDNQQGLVQELVNALCQLKERDFSFDARANLFQSCSDSNLLADIVFMLGGSSENGRRFQKIKNTVASIIKDLPDSFRFALVQFGEDVETQFQLDTYSQKQLVRKAIKKLKPDPGPLRAGKVLRYVRQNQFVKSAGSRIADGVPQVAIIVLPEKSHDAVSAAASELRHHGVSVFAFGTEHSDQQQLKNIVNEKLSSHISYIDQDPVESILMQLCRGVFNEIHSVPQVTTKVHSDMYKSDVVIVMDGSKSVSKMNFNHMRNFVYSMLYGMDLSMETARVGLVQIGNVPHAEFSLRDFTKKQSLLDTIMTLNPKGGARMTGHTLDFVLRDMLSDSTADRTKTVIVLVTGKSADSVQAQADKLSREGVNTFTIGLKGEIDDDLALMASAHQKSHLIALTCFKQLSRIPDEVISIMARPTLKSAASSTDLSGLDMETSEACRASIADILIVMDGSSSIIGKNFEILKKFFCQFVGNFEIGPQYMQIGMMQYSTDPHTEFLFNECPKKEDVVKAIQNIKQVIGDTYTAEALRYAVKHFYIKSTGNRLTAGVPQMAIVFTDGEAHDKYEVEASVKELKDLGVKVLCIGVQNALIEELELIASSPELVYYVDDFTDLENIETYVSDMVCDQPKDCSMDVLVGLDVSETNEKQKIWGQQFQLKSKLEEVLENLSNLSHVCKGAESIGVHVGVVAFGKEEKVLVDTGLKPYNPEILVEIEKSTGPSFLQGSSIKGLINVFNRKTSQGSMKVAVYFTDGLDEDIRTIQDDVERLRASGVSALLIVLLEGATDANQLVSLEFGRGYRYSKHLQLKQLDLPYEVREDVEAIAEKTCCGVMCRCTGQPGSTGPQGSTGNTGKPGVPGYKGHMGEYGSVGQRGATGPPGSPGIQGCPGVHGDKGSRGLHGQTGNKGDVAFDGVDGEQGDKGPPGQAGRSGSPGDWGPSGSIGAPGHKGLPGIRGNAGDPGVDSSETGPNGERGVPGPQGKVGKSGGQGSSGDEGNPGIPGPRGRPGAKGESETEGEPGAPGEPGVQGSQGVQGKPGKKGRPGESGMRGPTGSLGKKGKSGDEGQLGPRGPKGDPGTLGEKGRVGTVGPRGESGMNGGDTVGPPGDAGEKGEIGFSGFPGPPGEAGTPGSSGDLGKQGIRGLRGISGQPGTTGDPGKNGQPGNRGPPGISGPPMKRCALLKIIRQNCACCHSSCPVYPTELAFVIENSLKTTKAAFDRNKAILAEILSRITLAASTCPKGARVALVTYDQDTHTLVHFTDFVDKSGLLKFLENLPFRKSQEAGDLALAMRTVARRTFKRVRGGVLTQKLAVFLPVSGVGKDNKMNAAVLELSAQRIGTVILATEELPQLEDVLRLGEPSSQIFVIPKNKPASAELLKKLMDCAVCHDECTPNATCPQRGSWPETPSVNMDMVFIVDGSTRLRQDQFQKVKAFMKTAFGLFPIVKTPERPDGAQIGVVLHGPLRPEFNLTTYTGKGPMRKHVQRMQQIVGGVGLAGQTIKWTMQHVFPSPINRLDAKRVMVVLTNAMDGDPVSLRSAALQAKCQGFVVVMLGVGGSLDGTLASRPKHLHSLQLEDYSELTKGHVAGLFHQLVQNWKDDLLPYPDPMTAEMCKHLIVDGRPVADIDNILPDGEIPQIEIVLENITESSFIVHWKPVIGVSTYSVHVEDVETGDVVLNVRTNRTQMLVTGLECGHEYQATVTASLRQQQPFKTHIVLRTRMQMPATAFVSAVGSETVSLMWTPPRIADPTSYNVYIQKISDAQTESFSVGIKYDTYTFMGLKPNTSYYVGVAALHGQVESEVMWLPVKTKLQMFASRRARFAYSESCLLPFDEGMCYGYSLKWYFSSRKRACLQFRYRGCGGNKNRYNTKQHCEFTCQSLRGLHPRQNRNETHWLSTQQADFKQALRRTSEVYDAQHSGML